MVKGIKGSFDYLQVLITDKKEGIGILCFTPANVDEKASRRGTAVKKSINFGSSRHRFPQTLHLLS